MTMAPVAVDQAELTRSRTEVSEAESLHLTRNLLRIAMFNISYIRGLFPEKFYHEKFVPALEMKVKKLLPMDMESKRFIDWMEKGVFDALQKKYLRTLFFTICRGQDGPLVEEYMFSFKYSAKGTSEKITSMTIESSSGKPVHTSTDYQTTPQQMKYSACKMVRTLIQLMYTLDNVPKERTIVMKLHYYDDVTPADYEPPFFASSTYEDHNPWAREPVKMKVGKVDSRHYKLAIKLKSALDPCQEDNELIDNETCSGDLMATSDDDSSTSSEAMEVDAQPSQPCSQPSQIRKKVLPQAPESTEQPEGALEEISLANRFKKMQTTAEEAHNSDTDKTEDSEFEAESLRSMRIYLQTREDRKIHMTDMVQEFPQISMVLIKELVERLVEDEVLIILTKDLFHIKKTQIEHEEGTELNDAHRHYGEKTKSVPKKAETSKNTSKAGKALDDHLDANVKHQRLYEMITAIRLAGLYNAAVENGLKKVVGVLAVYLTQQKTKCDNTYVLQRWGVRIRAHEQSKTRGESGCWTRQVLGSDDTRQEQPTQQGYSSANNKHTIAISSFKEPPLPYLATQEGTKVSAVSEQSSQPYVTQSTMGTKGKRISILKEDLFSIKKSCSQIEREGGTELNDVHQDYGVKTKSVPRSAETIKNTSKAGTASDDHLDTDVKHQRLYELALLYTLPRDYITIKQLQVALVDASSGKIHQIISQMCLDGYIEKSPKRRRKGREVFHTPKADKKLQELRAFFKSKMQKDELEQKTKCDRTDASQPRGARIRAHEQCKTIGESGCWTRQVLGSDNTQRDQPIQRGYPSANNKHTKSVSSFKEPPLPQLAMQERAKINVYTRKQLVPALRVYTPEGAKGSAVSEHNGHPHVTPSNLEVKGKRRRMQGSDSPLDVNMDNETEMVGRKMKASKVDGPIYQPPFKRSRTR